MNLKELEKEYNILQQAYGDSELDSITFGGCKNNPDIFFVFMNPTKRNIASNKNWHGLKAPWIGTKNTWDLFFYLDLLSKETYQQIKSIKGKEWTEEFAEYVYQDVAKHRYFITNLAKCTQLDARELKDEVFYQYLNLLEEEIKITNPKVIILFGNQVSSIILNEKISVSKTRKKCYFKEINNKIYKLYPVYYPVGNGRFNMDKAIEDIKWIIKKEI